MLTPYGHTFSIKARGQTWSGIWEMDGKDVRVTSAFGSEKAPVGRRTAEKVASEILDRLVSAWASGSNRGPQTASGRPR